MRKKLAIILTIAMLLPMVVMALPASADYATYTTRLSGATRVETAVAVSVKKYAATAAADNVVLARKDMFPDALAGGVLADAKIAPILLTSSTSLDGAAKDEINRSLNGAAGTVYILGGTGAISADVENAVKALDSDYTVT
ncbi:cell wall-binding repeat-containing protein, partial [Candidatus Oleimmundimicrobium sp.]|uniref:cell wall-binding repeat-containing protein n=1 Tax=Candidatus Oleimmundimicrobium sp. TaxID=3060597 RepID=UPI0027172678